MSRYQRKDRFYDRAKSGGYRARSAYKLQELDNRYRLLRRGGRVVDLGAWPGAWLQVAAERIGPTGRAVGLDLTPITSLELDHVVTLTGDVCSTATIAAVVAAAAGLADLVLCDIAPKLSGVRATDEARRAALFTAVMAALPELLAPGGSLLLKLFMDSDYQAALHNLRETFQRVTTTRPEATRPGSAELYVVATGFTAIPSPAC